MEQLPIELLLSILYMVYYADDGLPDLKTLCNCSRVRTAWRGLSQQLLFRVRHLKRTRHPLTSLQETFSNVSLRSHVRIVNLAVGVDDESHMNGAYTPAELVQIITMFPRLYELCFNCMDPEADGNIILTLADSRIVFPPIRSLKFFNTKRNSPPPLERPDLQLKQLTIQLLPEKEIVQWLVPSGSRSLQFLQINQIRSFPSLANIRNEAFVEEHGPSLRSLRLPSVTVLSKKALSLCSNLEELDVGTMTMQFGHESIKSLSKSIYHVRIRTIRSDDGIPRPLLRSLPHLRVLTVPDKIWGQPIAETPEWVEFETECLQRKVSILYESFLRHLEDDAVIAERFPRGRSVDNFRLMNY